MMVNETIASRIRKDYNLNCFDVISRAVDLYSSADDFAYLYGAKGQVLTDSTIRALMAAEPVYFAKYTDDQIREIFFFFQSAKSGLTAADLSIY